RGARGPARHGAAEHAADRTAAVDDAGAHRHGARGALGGAGRAREGGVGSLSVRTVLAAAAVLLALGTAAASATAPAAKYPGFKVGAILPTSSHDLGFSQAMTVAAREL